MARSIFQDIAIIVFYFTAAVVLVGLPIHFEFLKRISATVSTDPIDFLWWLARWPHTFATHSSPFYTHLIRAPVGQNIAWTTCIPGLAILLSPVTSAGGAILSFNVAAVTAPAMAATGLYLACRELDLPWQSALFGGWLFGFSSYEFAQLLGELNLAVVWALPFLLWLFLLRLHERIGRMVFIGSSALLAAFQFSVSNEVFASAVVFASIAMALAVASPALLRDMPNLKRTILESGASLVLSLIILAPYLYSMLSLTSDHARKSIGLSPSAVIADPLNFFIPTPVLWLGTRVFGPLGHVLAGGMSDMDAYLGIPLIGIVVLYAWEFGQTPRARYLLVMLATFAVLSLGSRLRILGQIVPVFQPWLIFLHMPLIGKALSARFSLYVSMVGAVIAGIWYARTASEPWKKRLAACLAVLFLVPNVDFPPMRGSLPKPPFFAAGLYRDYIKPGERVIVLPNGLNMWFQVETGFYFRMVGGSVGGAVPRPFSRIPIYKVLGGGPLIPNYKLAFREFLRTYKVGAIVVYGPQGASTRALLASLPVRGMVVGGVTIFNLRPPADAVLRHDARKAV